MSTTVARSPWHEGELEAQRRAGIDPAYTAKVGPFLRPCLNEQHRDFYSELPFVVAGALDDAGHPWATLLQGDPGFLQALDQTRLHVDAEPDADDPARPGFAEGRDIALLGIQLETRRRNRLNGRIERDGDPGFDIVVDRAYGNCPKYITTHELQWTPAQPRPAEVREGLDDEARATIAAATSFYIASHAGVARGGVDVSLRGGRPGFVAVDGDWLTVPDFQGNQFFNTLGNLLVDPHAGLLFVDFPGGDLLQLTGTAEVLYDSPLLARFAGAQRGFRVRVEGLVRRRGALAWRGSPLEASPAVARTDTWAELRAREAASG